MTVLSMSLTHRDGRWELWVSFEPPKPHKDPASSSRHEPKPAPVVELRPK
jgi:hypothetical protein